MSERRPNPESGARDAAGFALILAILALMLLTFLGLTLATTTSSELQIATNYRWSQQALYNAEAGMEAGKLILASSPLWIGLVPPDRPTPGWSAGSGVLPTPWAPTGRDFEQKACPGDRGGQGYGVVLNAPPPPGTAANMRWESIGQFMGQPLNGAFTIWVRRELVSDPAGSGKFWDDPANPVTNLVMTVEGVAPYTAASNFTRANQARRVLEMTWTLLVGQPCRQLGGQKGQGPTGENFDPCSTLSAGAAGSLAGAFGNAANRVGAAGVLTGTGAQ
jgi:hypothetical protein